MFMALLASCTGEWRFIDSEVGFREELGPSASVARSIQMLCSKVEAYGFITTQQLNVTRSFFWNRSLCYLHIAERTTPPLCVPTKCYSKRICRHSPGSIQTIQRITLPTPATVYSSRTVAWAYGLTAANKCTKTCSETLYRITKRKFPCFTVEYVIYSET
jgi:hypothetical protein